MVIPNATKASLLDKVATYFETGPSPNDNLRFHPSPTVMVLAKQLLALNRSAELEDPLRKELDQLEMLESLMRLVKARIRVFQLREHSYKPFSKQQATSCDDFYG